MKRTSKGFLALVLGTAAVWMSAGETLENDALRIRFAPAAEGFTVVAVENRLAGEVRFVHPAAGEAGFWRLDFLRGANEHIVVDNRAPAVRKAVRTAQGMRFVWQGIDLADERGVLDVTAEVTLPPGKAASEWRLTATNRSMRAALYRTSYPLLRCVTPAGKGDVLMPYKELGAVLLRKYDGRNREEVACTPGWRPPVTAFNLGEAGLYLAAHDPEVRIKDLIVGKGQDVRFDTIVEDAGLPGRAAEGPRYAVTLAAYRGDWWQAAKLYRAWALKQKWAAKGPIATRPDYPAALRDMDLLLRLNEHNVQAMSNHIAAVRRIWPDLKVGIHWYSWTPQAFCVNFPEFFPARPGAVQTAEFARRQGVTLIPYVDARSWDVDQASWTYAKRDACRQVDGRTVDEVYSPRHRLAVMCPSSPQWREVVAKLTHDAIGIGTSPNAVGFGGIYHDQFTCSRAVPCWAADHPHAKGGGAWWTEGYRQALAPVHDWCAARNAPILSEGTDDTYLDLVDGLLKASPPHADEVPFHPAVYAGYTVYYGNYANLKEDADSFRAYQMRDFTRGVLLGWLDCWKLTLPEFAAQQRLFGTLARARRTAAEFMIHGSLEDELRLVEPPPEGTVTVTRPWSGRLIARFSLPVVMGTVWRNRAGTATAVVAANWSGAPQTVRFRAPAAGLAPRPLPDFPLPECVTSADGLTTLALAPCAVVYLRTTE